MSETTTDGSDGQSETSGVEPERARSDAGVGGAVHADAGEGFVAAQGGPVMDMYTATNDERVDGVIRQVRADVTGQNAATVEHALRGRLRDTGLTLDEDRIAQLVAELSE